MEEGERRGGVKWGRVEEGEGWGGDGRWVG